MLIRIITVVAVLCGFVSLIYSQSAMPPGRYVEADDIASALASSLEQRANFGAVSYTHLTLPTKRIV